MNRFQSVSSLLLGLSLVSSCGSGLAGDDYQGEAQARLQGTVLLNYEFDLDELMQASEGELRLTIMWAKLSSVEDDDPDDFIGEDQVLTNGKFPARYEVRLFQPPPDSVLFEVGPKASNGKIAIGTIMVYVDEDGDGKRDSNEDFVGGPLDQRRLIYTPSGAHNDQYDWQVEAGYTVMEVYNPFCEDIHFDDQGEEPPRVGFFPVSDDQQNRIDLEVSPDLDSPFFDLDCDGEVDEWDECEPEILDECAQNAIDHGTPPDYECPELALCGYENPCISSEYAECLGEAIEDEEDPADVCEGKDVCVGIEECRSPEYLDCLKHALYDRVHPYEKCDEFLACFTEWYYVESENDGERKEEDGEIED